MKSILQSRTVWVAIVQAVLSVVVVILTEADMVGYVGIIKSIVDILLRIDTTDVITK